MMNDASTPTKQPAAVNPPGKLAHALASMRLMSDELLPALRQVRG